LRASINTRCRTQDEFMVEGSVMSMPASRFTRRSSAEPKDHEHHDTNPEHDQRAKETAADLTLKASGS
jgi:hypothetical protein